MWVPGTPVTSWVSAALCAVFQTLYCRECSDFTVAKHRRIRGITDKQ